MLQSVYEWIEPNQETQHDENIEQFIQQAAEDLSIPKMVAKVIYEKGYHSFDQMQNYIDKEPNFHDPFLFYDMEKAVKRLQTAIEDYEEILIYGDYDADGITSATILYETLEMLGANVDYYLPNRFDDGYGPNKDVYAYYIKKGVQLILTCDNGVAGHEAIQYAKEQGVDVIVTDHHEIGDSLPDAYAIIHPRHPQGNYPFDDLSGAGVALKVATALLGEIPTDLLDVAAIGTVADLVSLTDENRVLVAAGLKQMKMTERLGLQAFFEKEKIKPDQIDETTIGFILGPRLNALGRLGDPNPGVKFLTSFDDEEITGLVDLLEENNTERKAIVEQMANEAQDLINQQSTMPNIIILGHEGWHEGVLGIVASRMVEIYHRPTILLSKNVEKGTYKGSGRSIEGVDLFKVLQAGKDFASKFGGHEMAAGMTVEIDQFEAWQSALQAVVTDEYVTGKTPMHIDAEISLDTLTLDNIKALSPLKPFGTDNKEPLFLLRNLNIHQIQLLGKDKNTLKLTVENDEMKVQMIAFKSGAKAEKLVEDQPVDVVASLSINSWNGNQEPQALIKDIRQVGESVFDIRSLRKREQILSIPNAVYLFENELFYQEYQEEIPYDATSLLMDDLPAILDESTHEMNHENLVIFDIPLDKSLVKAFVERYSITNIYIFAFSPFNAYMAGTPTREDFSMVYKYLLGHGNIPLKGNEQALAGYFKMDKQKLNLMIEVLLEAGLVNWHNQDLVTVPASEKVDLLETANMKKWQLQIEGERFFIYNDVKKIRDYFFQEDNNEF